MASWPNKWLRADYERRGSAVNGEQAPMIYPGEGKEGQPKAGDYVLAAERVRAEAAATPWGGRDLTRADRWEAKVRTKELPSTRTRIGAGGELIDSENKWDALGVVDTVADPDYVTADASRDRLELANEAGSLGLALDAADTIQAQDSLECMKWRCYTAA